MAAINVRAIGMLLARCHPVADGVAKNEAGVEDTAITVLSAIANRTRVLIT